MDQTSDQSQPLAALGSQSNQLNSSNLAPVAGGMSTNQSSRNYPVDVNLPPPGQQSAVYAKLRQAISDYDSKNSMTDEQANQKFQEILRIRNQANVNAESGGNVLSGPGAGANPTGIPGPEEPNLGQSNPGPGMAPAPSPNLSNGRTGNNDLLKQGFGAAPNNMGAGPGMGLPPVSAPPVPINSFASGIKSKGLADLIASGEVAVQQGQFDKAIAAYNQAVDVVPNNPLILMARATAELGGQYYAQADADIHLAIAEDPAVLVGQYDLEKHLGQARMKSTLADLKNIAQNSQDDTMHAFLLTYAYYNSHHVGQAAEWLQTTDGRTHGQDPAIMQMKKYWNFNDELPIPQPKTAGPTTRSAH
jgi:tetratricopeptide (TPR) repeat protein